MQVTDLDINNHLGIIDLYIFSSGFEKRATKLGLKLNRPSVKHSFGFHMEETYRISSVHLQEIKDNLPQTKIIKYPKNRPLAIFDKFFNTINQFINDNFRGEKLKIVIDVTVFTREVLLILLKVMFSNDFREKMTIKLVYTPLLSYGNDGQDLWLTKGIREIRSIVGYSGIFSPVKELLLILLVGFEEERAENIIATFEPKKLILGKPTKKDSVTEYLNDISSSKFSLIKDRFNSILLDEFEFSCLNILEAKNQIKNILSKYNDDYNIVISPLNNKISTLGVGIAAFENQEVQICYASANQYNIDAPQKMCDYFLSFDTEELFTS
jgi:hypothetical protein